jgi:hypothetical protein
MIFLDSLRGIPDTTLGARHGPHRPAEVWRHDITATRSRRFLYVAVPLIPSPPDAPAHGYLLAVRALEAHEK